MVAKISSGSSVYGALNYNKIKEDKDEAEVLYSQKMFVSADGDISLRDCMDSFYPYLAVNQRTTNVVFHASINPDPKDKLSDEQLTNLCQEYMDRMGYGNQPYVVFLHQDIQRKHAHIVSLRIDENGKKISDKFEHRKSMAICRELEIKHNLHIPDKKQRTEESPTKKIDYKAGDIKHQIGNITKAIMKNYNFQSFGEYRTLLEIFNITVEEVNGEHKGRAYHGLIYSATNDNREKVGVPIKASLFGKSVGYETLQKKFEKSKMVIEKSDIKDRLRLIISDTMKRSHSIDDFRKSLLQQGIGCVFRQNEQGRIYGVSFIDYQNQTILNGSRLGKEFSANVFNDLLNNPSERNIQQTVNNKSQLETNRLGQSPESVGVQRSSESDSLGLLSFEQHGTDYESENFAREKEKEEKVRQRKNKYRGRGM